MQNFGANLVVVRKILLDKETNRHDGNFIDMSNIIFRLSALQLKLFDRVLRDVSMICLTRPFMVLEFLQQQ